MGELKRQHSASFKAKVALEALKETSTIAELSSQHGVHSTQIRKWKQEAADRILSCFSSKEERKSADQTVLVDELYKQIGQLKVELDWLKKKVS